MNSIEFITMNNNITLHNHREFRRHTFVTCIMILCRCEMKNDCEAREQDLFIMNISVKITHHNVEDNMFFNSQRRVHKNRVTPQREFIL